MSTPLKIEKKLTESMYIFECFGEFDETNVDPEFSSVFDYIGEMNIPKFVIFQLGEVSYVNSKFIGYIADLSNQLEKNNGRLYLSGADQVYDTLDVCGIAQIIQIFDTIDAAKDYIRDNHGEVISEFAGNYEVGKNYVEPQSIPEEENEEIDFSSKPENGVKMDEEKNEAKEEKLDIPPEKIETETQDTSILDMISDSEEEGGAEEVSEKEEKTEEEGFENILTSDEPKSTEEPSATEEVQTEAVAESPITEEKIVEEQAPVTEEKAEESTSNPTTQEVPQSASMSDGLASSGASLESIEQELNYLKSQMEVMKKRGVELFEQKKASGDGPDGEKIEEELGYLKSQMEAMKKRGAELFEQKKALEK